MSHIDAQKIYVKLIDCVEKLTEISIGIWEKIT